MDQHSKAELIKSYRKRYKKADKKDKSRIISVIVDATGYSRNHVIKTLNDHRHIVKKIRRTRKSKYTAVIIPLRQIWAIANFICGKRLKPFMPHASSKSAASRMNLYNIERAAFCVQRYANPELDSWDSVFT